MATIKNNWLRAGLSLIILLLGIIVFVSAQTSKNVVAATKKAAATTTYYYHGPAGNLQTNIMVPEHWETTPSAAFDCVVSRSQVPCSLEVPAEITIANYLEELGNLASIKAATDSRREPAQ